MKSHKVRFFEKKISPDKLWPHKLSDLNAAVEIIRKYAERDGFIKFIEGFEEVGETLTITISEWKFDLIKYFSTLYGEQASEVVCQVIYSIFEDTLGPPAEEFQHKDAFVRLTERN